MRIQSKLVQVLVVVALLAVPVATVSAQSGRSMNGFVWDGQAYVPDVVSEPPAALPETGYDWASALREAYAQLRHDGSVEPVAGLHCGCAWREAYAQLQHDRAVAPASLPKTGAGEWEAQCVNGYFDDGSLIYACGAEGVLPQAIEPSSLPRTGVDVNGLAGQDGLKRLDPTQDCRWCLR